MLAVPEQLYRNHGYRRIFVEKALQDLLPGDILAVRGKGLQAADLVERLRAEGPSIPDLGALNGHALWLDAQRMAKAIRILEPNQTGGPEPGMNRRTMVYWLRSYSVTNMKCI
jgi:hypothetical protein